MNMKLTGSYYTPNNIAEFICDIVSNKISLNDLSVLEPSAGDGSFINSLSKMNYLNSKKIKITAVDISASELEKISLEYLNDNITLETINKDYLEYASESKIKYDLIIGNPPYIKESLLGKNQINMCRDIGVEFDIKFKNIWPAFLLLSLKSLNDNGVLAFVLPAELMQVNYAKKIRDILINYFDRIEIYTFNELIFKDCKGQDTIIFIGEKKASSKHGLFFSNIDDQYKLKELAVSFEEHSEDSQLKWTSHVISSEEIIFIEGLSKRLPKISDICTSKTGIVTAANDFFILNESKRKSLDIISDSFKPILQKSSFIGNSIILSRNFHKILRGQDMPCHLLDLKGIQINIDTSLLNYISKGEALGLDKRYKMTKRVNWFEIPNISKSSPILFFKRSHLYPKIVKNNASILATDSAYYVYPVAGYDANSVVASFYNSLTLIMAEIQGRYYGGGVLEITPSEFKSLPLPYKFTDYKQLKMLDNMFRDKSTIADICLYNDKRLFSSYGVNLSDNELSTLSSIREKLVGRRLRSYKKSKK